MAVRKGKPDPMEQGREATQRARARLREIERGEAGHDSPFSRHCPHPPSPKQELFLKLDCLEALFGGAAGGGKSDALLMGALQHVDQPGYAALILRRTLTDAALSSALLERSHAWLRDTPARWDERDATWTFPSGARVTFGFMRGEWDHLRYQSSQFNYIAFDELTQFREKQYLYMFSRLRRASGQRHIPLRMRSASNPGGIGHRWVKQRFIVGGSEAGTVFVPSKLEDNPGIDREPYLLSLARLDPVTRRQLLEGDWDAEAGGTMFQRDWFHFALPNEIPSGLRWVRCWDLAATEPKPGRDPDWTVGARVAVRDGVYWVADVRRVRERPAGVERLIRATAEADGPAVQIWVEQEPGASGVTVIDHYARRVLRGFTFRGHKTTGAKSERAAPVASAAENGNVRLAAGAWNAAFLDEFEAFPNGDHDDQVDTLSLAFAVLNRPNRYAMSF